MIFGLKDVWLGFRHRRERFATLAALKVSLDRFSREGVFETLQYLRQLSSYGVAFKSFTEAYLDGTGIFKDAIIAFWLYWRIRNECGSLSALPLAWTESSDGLVTLAAAWIVTGWSEPVHGSCTH